MPDSSPSLLITRPAGEAAAFAAAVEAAWPGAFRYSFLPLTRIEREAALLDLSGIQSLLFSSANGVRAFAEVSDRRDLPALCVGDSTALVARQAGFAAESAEGDSAALARLAAAAWLPGAGDFLHVRGRDTAGDLPGALAPEGIGVREVILYDARAIPEIPGEAAAALESGRHDVILFFSPRAGTLFAGFAAEAAEAGRGWAVRRVTALTISRRAAEPLQALDFARITVAPRPDRSGMIEALGQFVGV